MLPSLASVLCVAAALVTALNRGFCERTAGDIFLSLLMASVAIVFVQIRPHREILQLVVVFAGLVASQAFGLRVGIHPGPAGALLGVAAFLLLALRGIWSTLPKEKEMLYYGLLPPLLLVLLGYLSAGLMDETGRLHPKTFDLYLYAFDGSLGGQLSFAAGRLVLRSHWLTRMCLFWYYVLPAALLLVYAQQLVRRREAALAAFLAFFLAGPAGIIFYNLFPACGPVYLFPAQFPADPVMAASLLIQPVAVTGARNAFPSLHMAWALLAWWYSEGLPRWARALLFMVLAGTVLATLGLGEHYVVDLVAAVPFALTMRAASAGQISRRGLRSFLPLLAGLSWMAAWVGILRFGVRMMRMSLLIPWTLVGCTLLSCIVLQVRLPGVGREVRAGSP